MGRAAADNGGTLDVDFFEHFRLIVYYWNWSFSGAPLFQWRRWRDLGDGAGGGGGAFGFLTIIHQNTEN